jgi:nucleotide-binding universal stress UspA family protein
MNPHPPALKHLLAATDLSPPARHAADRAARLAQEHGAALTLLHVLPQGPLDDLKQWLGAPLAQQLRDSAERELAALGAELQQARHAHVQVRVETGTVLDALDRTAVETDAGLVVLGARGAGFLRRLVLGTTAERLLRRTTRPLLVVRQAAHERYRRVLLALDFSPWSEQVLAQARSVAPQAHWVLFNAFQVPFEEKLRFAGVDEATVAHYRHQARAQAMSRLQALADAAGLQHGRWEPCVVEGDASLRLVEQEQVLDCDLTVIGKHGQSAAEDLLLGSVTKHLLAEGVADVLVATRPRS